MKKFFFLVFACVACSETPGKWLVMSQSDKLIALNMIASDCGSEQSAFNLTPSGGLAFQPGPEANYENVLCSSEKLKKLGALSKQGFIGREVVETEQQ